MICKNCGREIEEVRPRGASHNDDRVHVHVDTYLTICDHEAWAVGVSYFDLSHAEP